ncbi:hypothetical protein Tco_0603549 [Tanacetum coccineum]
MDSAGTDAPTLKSCLKASRIRSIDGKIVGKDGNSLRLITHVVGDVNMQAVNEKGNEKTKDQLLSQGDGVFSSLNTNHEETLGVHVVNKENLDTQKNSAWADPKVNTTKVSFANVVSAEQKFSKLNFRTLISNAQVEELDCVLPVENVMVVQNKFTNSLVGFCGEISGLSIGSKLRV